MECLSSQPVSGPIPVGLTSLSTTKDLTGEVVQSRKVPHRRSANQPVAGTLHHPGGVTLQSSTVSKDHSYAVLDSPRTLKRKLDKAVCDLDKCKKKLRMEQQKTRRLKQKVKSLKGVVNRLRSENLISSSCAEMLESTFEGVPTKDIMLCILNKKKKKANPAYPEQQRAFAMTLQFYSAKAYNYVRERFDLALPHPRQIREWYAATEADPGFTKPALEALAARAADNKCKGKEIVCALMLDEMTIRKQIQFVNGKYKGFVDIGF